MRVDDLSGYDAELLGRRGKKLSRKQKRKLAVTAFLPIPGARIAAALKARRAKKGPISRSDKKRALRIVGAAALMPGAGTVGLMIAAAKKRIARRKAQKKSAGLNIVPDAALPVSVAVPSAPGVMAPIYARASYTPPAVDSYDDTTDETPDENDENEEIEEIEENEEIEEKNFWE